MQHYVLRLFVAGHSARSERAIANLREICENDLGGHYELTVVDVLERPAVAEQEKVAATPTLIKVLPEPIRRIIGDLSDRDQVLVGLDLEVH